CALGAAPAFRLDGGGGHLPKSWVLLDIEMTMRDEMRDPILQVDEGRGYDHSRSIDLPGPENGRLRAVVLLPNVVRGLRLDLPGWTGEFRLGRASMREVGKLELGIRGALPLIRSVLREPRHLPTFTRRAVALLRTGGLQALKDRLAATDRQTEEYGRWIGR